MASPFDDDEVYPVIYGPQVKKVSIVAIRVLRGFDVEPRRYAKSGRNGLNQEIKQFRLIS